MALCRTGGFLLKATKPIFGTPVFVLPSSASLQKRHAARKGYREKAQKQKKIEKVKSAVGKVEQKLIKKFSNVTKTEDLKKPEAPNDDVLIRTQFNYIKYSLPEIINFHREYHHPTVFNNPSAPLSLKIEIRMVGKKETQVLKPFSGVAPIPHPFTISVKREILVFCKPEDADLAFKSGAAMAGGADLIKKIKDGTVQPVLYDYVISHTNMLQELHPIRNILKLQYPRTKSGTLTSDLEYSIKKFLHGIEYSCVNIGSSKLFGVIGVDVGTLDMETDHLVDNFKAVIEDIEQHRPKKEGEFITWIWCQSRPSYEQFSVDLSQYIKTEKVAEVPETTGKRAKAAAKDDEDDDDDDDDAEDDENEREKMRSG